MIELMLSANAAFVVLWCLLTVAALSVWPLLKRLAPTLHPDPFSQLLLVWFALPLTLALLLCTLLYTPLASHWLVDSHCHNLQCGDHVPTGVVPGVGIVALLATVTALIFLGISAARAQRHHRQILTLLKQGARQQRDYWTLLSDQARAFTVGFWRPTVVVSRGLLDACEAADLDILLAHEFAHRRRRDNLRLLLMSLLTLPMPPSLRDSVRSCFRLTLEKSCDLYAAERHSKLAVANTLVKVARLCQDQGDARGITAFANHHVESRVHFLLQAPPLKPHRAVWFVALAAVPAIALQLVAPLHHEVEQLLRLLAG